MAKLKTSLSLTPEACDMLRAIALRLGSEHRGMSIAAELCIRDYAERNGIKPKPKPKPRR